MVTATILYVGDDLCHRVPVMETNGMRVVCSACSVAAVRAALAKCEGFSAVTFHNDLFAPRDAVVSTARKMCKAPLILFRNPAVDCDEQAFDFVIPVPMEPDVWTDALAEAIVETRRVQDRSRRLRRERADAREWSRSVREMSARGRTSSFDRDAGFRAGADGTEKDKLDH
jgi:hypothetical protein